MSVRDFASLSDDSRLWLFGSDRELTPSESARLEARTRAFLELWTAHRSELATGLGLRDARFLLIAVDESVVSASGCSIDALMHHLEELERELDVGLRDGALVWFRGPSGEIQCVDRPEFRSLAERGEVDSTTPVFDLTLATLGALRAGRLEVPAGSSWHARLITPRSTGIRGTPA